MRKFLKDGSFAVETRFVKTFWCFVQKKAPTCGPFPVSIRLVSWNMIQHVIGLNHHK